MKRKLYKLHVKGEYCNIGYWLVVAQDPNEAEVYLLKLMNKWHYPSRSSMYVTNIELLSTEGQYGKPSALLFAEEDVE